MTNPYKPSPEGPQKPRHNDDRFSEILAVGFVVFAVVALIAFGEIAFGEIAIWWNQ